MFWLRWQRLLKTWLFWALVANVSGECKAVAAASTSELALSGYTLHVPARVLQTSNGCTDMLTVCGAWAQQGYCNWVYTYNNQSVLEVVCPRACKGVRCGCVDTMSYCASWAQQGYCAPQYTYGGQSVLNVVCPKSCIGAPCACPVYDGYTLTRDVDHGFDDIANYGAGAVTQCSADPSCMGFNSDGWIKRNVTGVQAKASYCFYTKIVTSCPPYPGYTVTPDVDHSGDDIGNFGSNAAAQCSANPTCMGFNSGGWVKKNVTGVQPWRGSCLYTKAATSCPPYPGYTVTPDVDHYGDDIGNFSSNAAAQCSANPTCMGFNSGGWVKKNVTGVQPWRGSCLYTKVTGSAFTLQYSTTFCGGQPAGAAFKTVSDRNQAALYPLSSFKMMAGIVLNSLTPAFQSDQLTGTVHGGLAGGGPYSFTLNQSADPVVAVSTCCSGSYWSNSAMRIHLRMASGNEFCIGDTSWLCVSPQPWVSVPTGYILGGFETTETAAEPWVHGLTYIFVDARVLSSLNVVPPPSSSQPPPSPPSPPAASGSASCRYTVKAGDTLYALAQLYGSSVYRLQTLNPTVVATNMQLGQSITVPCSFGDFRGSGCLYVVKQGDTVYAISVMYGTTPDKLKETNPGIIDDSSLQIGQAVRVPCPSGTQSGCRYMVKNGDTFYSISLEVGASVSVLMNMNPGVLPQSLQPGQQINYPCSQGSCTPYAGYVAIADVDHVGDNLYLFSRETAAAQCAADPACKGFTSNGWTKSAVDPTVISKGLCLYRKTFRVDWAIDFFSQCGGLNPPPEGYCGSAGNPCQDAPWISPVCRVGSTCTRFSAWWWQCIPDQAAAPAKPTGCTPLPGYAAVPDVDHNGDNIGFCGTASAAAVACNTDKTCVGFNSNGWTKRIVAPLALSPGLCFYVKNNPVCKTYEGFTSLPDTDHIGDNMGNFGENAANQCKADPACRGFSRDGVLKRAISPTTPRAGFCLYAKVTTGTDISGYTFYEGKTFLIPTNWSDWLAGRTEFVDIQQDNSADRVLLKELCDLDPTCSAFTTDGVLKRGPITAAALSASAFWSIGSKMGIYLKNSPAPLIPRPREPRVTADCQDSNRHKLYSSMCYMDIGRTVDLLNFNVLKQSGASNIYNLMLANPHVNWWRGSDATPIIDGVNICVCPGPGMEATRWMKSRPEHYSCLADLSEGRGGLARPCSGYTSDYAKARCFCHMQVDRQRRAYIWPFKHQAGSVYDCDTFIECENFRPVVVNNKFRRQCNSFLDPSEPRACPGCKAVDPVFGEEGNNGNRSICQAPEFLPLSGGVFQCADKEPGNFCHWWMLPAGLYQDPFDQAGTMVMRCPASSIEALYGKPDPAYCMDITAVFDNRLQQCVPRPLNWNTTRVSCPARRVTVAAPNENIVLSQCDRSFIGYLAGAASVGRRSRHLITEESTAIDGTSTASVRPATTTANGSITAITLSRSRVLQGGAFKNIQFMSVCNVNGRIDPDTCCPATSNIAAENGCYPSARNGFKQADDCWPFQSVCGTSNSVSVPAKPACRCEYRFSSTIGIKLGVKPAACPSAAYTTCKFSFSRK